MAERNERPKIKLAVYWGAACGGCCVSVLDVHEKLFDVVANADLVFWPIALDIKYNDVEAMPDQDIDVTLFNGAIRNSENKHMARLLRQKTKILVAYGSCAHLGGIPGLANLSTKTEIFDRIYKESESTNNPNHTRPLEKYEVKEGTLTLPEFFNDVRTLAQTVDVDYYLPGCPPQTERLLEVFMAIVSGDELPPRGKVLGATDKSQCDECPRKKSDKKTIKEFHRPWEINDDGETCFLEQGVLCMGPATRSGCGHRCIEVNAPCRGCYGPAPDVIDPGAKMMSSVATMIDGDTSETIEKILENVIDPAGYFYRFSMPASILRRKIPENLQAQAPLQK
ncbi:F420-nonreducing hydrogenase [Prolixibacteraceae bacterium Z1-6]|uniref:F420-nonreducing hydrogenase n=1 Tax=Draconibacterium aestuarii TaxID=2998507 RepID=A0A9X3F796_9BACT|nr:F420-nonreducing hydrogenase [Prolixibacteraceae bacterium Z1-6]